MWFLKMWVIYLFVCIQLFPISTWDVIEIELLFGGVVEDVVSFLSSFFFFFF